MSALGVGNNANTRVRAKPCVHVLIIPGHSRREVPCQAVDIVNPGNTMTIHRT